MVCAKKHSTALILDHGVLRTRALYYFASISQLFVEFGFAVTLFVSIVLVCLEFQFSIPLGGTGQ